MASLPQEWQKDYALMIKLYACYMDGFNAGMNVPLKEMTGKTSSQMDIILNTVCSYTGVSPDDIKGKTRKGEVVYARQLCMYYAKKHTKAILSLIGAEYGNRDHSTVLYAIECINNYLETDHRKKLQIDSIESAILIKIKE